MAVFLTIGLIELLASPQATVFGMIVLFIQQMGVGAICGLVLGWISTRHIERMTLDVVVLYAVLSVLYWWRTRSCDDSRRGTIPSNDRERCIVKSNPEAIGLNHAVGTYQYVASFYVIDHIDEYQARVILETSNVGGDRRLNLVRDRRLRIIVKPNQELHGTPRSAHLDRRRHDIYQRTDSYRASDREWAHRLPELTRPPDKAIVFRPVGPDQEIDEVVGRGAAVLLTSSSGQTRAIASVAVWQQSR
jgi:hypothetical protein